MSAASGNMRQHDHPLQASSSQGKAHVHVISVKQLAMFPKVMQLLSHELSHDHLGQHR